MTNIFKQSTMACVLTLSIAFFCLPAGAQQYKNLSDTTALNKAYGSISLDMSKLNTKLIEAKNKTAGYQQQTTSTAVDAVNSGEDSKTQAATATSGNTTDTRKAVRDAKRADRQANKAKDAIADEKKNNKKIQQLTASIEKKQKQLDDLDVQRAAIMAQLAPIPQAAADSSVRQ